MIFSSALYSIFIFLNLIQTTAETSNAIQKLSYENSQVMSIAESITNFGPRLTNTPSYDLSAKWILNKLKDLGIKNAHLDSWGPFGRGWSLERFWMNAKSTNSSFPIIAYPQAWSSGTNGVVKADVLIFNSNDPDYTKTYANKLAGKIVLIDEIRSIKPSFKALASRRSDAELFELAKAKAEAKSTGIKLPEFLLKQFKRDQEIFNFLLMEKPAAILFAGVTGGERGIVFPGSANVYEADLSDPYYFLKGTNAYDLKADYIVPQILVSVEHYNRLYRLAKSGEAVQIEMDLEVTYHQKNLMAYNVIAEIPGTDPKLKNQIVMLGAHLDSFHGGTGATDNGSGVAVSIETMRVLIAYYAQLGRQPKRTIRLALWAGEEQGLLGSTAYVNKYLAELEGGSFNLSLKNKKADYKHFSAYYNLDHGAGKIRGIWLNGFESNKPLFKDWLKQLTSLGVTTVSVAGLPGGSGSDHMPFVASGLPGFMFIQDKLEYNTLTHHSVMDEFDHLIAEDLKQSVAVMSYFIYLTAEKDELINRK